VEKEVSEKGYSREIDGLKKWIPLWIPLGYRWNGIHFVFSYRFSG
jgi:hypothetical protein